MALAVGLVLSGGTARAHPFQTALYGHRLTVQVDEGELILDALFEEPTPRVLAEYRVWADGQAGTPAEVMARHTALRLDELASGLSLAVDGVPVALARRELDERTGVGGADFIRYQVRLAAPLSAGWRQLSLVDTAHPGEKLASRWDLSLPPERRLDDSSLWWDERDLTGQWVTETPTLRCRELRLAATPLGGLSRVVLALGEALGAQRPQDDQGRVEARFARAAALEPALWRGGVSAALGLLGLLMGAGLAVWWRKRG